MGLGPNGEPLRNVALNLPSLQNQNSGSNLGGTNSNTPVPVAPPPSSFSSAANVLGQSQNPNLNNLAALTNVVGNLNNLNPLLSTLGLGGLAANPNDSANSSALDINKMVGAGSSAGNSGLSNVVSGSGSANYSSLTGIGSGLQSNRLDSSLSNPYSSNSYNNLSSNLGGLGSNANTGFGGNQRDFDMSGSVRSYNSQPDDFGRLSSQNFGSSQMGNGPGSNNNSNVGGNRSQNISDTILIRNVSISFINFSIFLSSF